MMQASEEFIQQNVIFSKMLEYFLEQEIITPKNIADFLTHFNTLDEGEVLSTKNPLINKQIDNLSAKKDHLDDLQKRFLDSLKND